MHPKIQSQAGYSGTEHCASPLPTLLFGLFFLPLAHAALIKDLGEEGKGSPLINSLIADRHTTTCLDVLGKPAISLVYHNPADVYSPILLHVPALCVDPCILCPTSRAHNTTDCFERG